jgi:hypothetical protein
MGLFDRLFNKEETKAAREAKEYFKTLTAYRPHFTTWHGSIFESELVRAAIDVRARHISKLKVEIVGSANPKLQTRLKQRPNSFMTWPQFLYRVSVILDVNNTAVITPLFNEYGETVGYWPILPTRCEVVEYQNEPYLRYEFKSGEKAAVQLSKAIVLTRFQYKSDFFGTDNSALDPTMKLIHVQNQGIEEAVKNGATYRFMARLSNFSLDEDIAKERQRFTESNMNAESGGLLLFPNGWNDIKQIESKPYTVSDAETEAIRTGVYNYFGVNTDVLQSKAYGDSWAAFYEGVVEHFAIQFSEGITFAAFTDREIAQGSRIMLTANRLQYMSTQDKLNVSAQMADRGIMNRDEIREIWNLPPLPNGAGQAYTLRGEYYLVDGDEKQTAAEAAEE